ncbi:MAG: CrcB family protein [Rhodobacteraceae bacterium]|nr:CrcB family protein [Paracoccaceae bacterium]
MGQARILLLIGLGGAVGTGLRAAISLAALATLPQMAYLATLAANILGALAIGWLVTRPLGPKMQALLMTGFCGGFTTFSFFSLEVMLLGSQQAALALAYGAGSLVLWMLAVWAGYRLGLGACPQL